MIKFKCIVSPRPRKCNCGCGKGITSGERIIVFDDKHEGGNLKFKCAMRMMQKSIREGMMISPSPSPERGEKE